MSLINDWCTAHGLDPDEVDDTLLEYFGSEVTLGRTRSAQAAAELRRHGAPLPMPAPASAVHRGANQLSARVAIARCPTSGRAGVRGRRDALILALLNQGLTRTQVSHLDPRRVDTTAWLIAGQPLEAGSDERTCPRCILARWLDVRAQLPPAGTRASAVSATLHRVEGHRCAGEVEPAWFAAGPLLPGLDRHGWPSLDGLGPRTITTIVAARTDPHTPEPVEVTAPTANPGLDAVAARRRIDALFDELDDRLGQIEAARPGVTRHRGPDA